MSVEGISFIHICAPYVHLAWLVHFSLGYSHGLGLAFRLMKELILIFHSGYIRFPFLLIIKNENAIEGTILI